MEVYGFLVDLGNWKALDDALVDLSASGPLVVGSRGTITRRVNGLRVTTAWEIVELVPGARFTNRIVGRGYELVETVDLAATPTGTAVTVTDDLVATSLLGRLMVPMSGGMIRRDLEKRGARLQALLEASPARR